MLPPRPLFTSCLLILLLSTTRFLRLIGEVNLVLPLKVILESAVQQHTRPRVLNLTIVSTVRISCPGEKYEHWNATRPESRSPESPWQASSTLASVPYYTYEIAGVDWYREYPASGVR